MNFENVKGFISSAKLKADHEKEVKYRDMVENVLSKLGDLIGDNIELVRMVTTISAKADLNIKLSPSSGVKARDVFDLLPLVPMSFDDSRYEFLVDSDVGSPIIPYVLMKEPDFIQSTTGRYAKGYFKVDDVLVEINIDLSDTASGYDLVSRGNHKQQTFQGGHATVYELLEA